MAEATPRWSEMFRVFGRIGLLSFGGPAAQIAMIEDAVVTEKKWLTHDAFLRGVGFCTLLPGPEAMQLATYAGWRLRGTLGGLLAGGLFVLPGAALVIALSLSYLAYGSLPAVQATFVGIKAAVLAIVATALWRLGRKTLHGALGWALAIAGFLALYFNAAPFPVVLAVAALLGYLTASPPFFPLPLASPLTYLPPCAFHHFYLHKRRWTDGKK